MALPFKKSDLVWYIRSRYSTNEHEAAIVVEDETNDKDIRITIDTNKPSLVVEKVKLQPRLLDGFSIDRQWADSKLDDDDDDASDSDSKDSEDEKENDGDSLTAVKEKQAELFKMQQKVLEQCQSVNRGQGTTNLSDSELAKAIEFAVEQAFNEIFQ